MIMRTRVRVNPLIALDAYGVLDFKFCIGEACCARRSNPRVNVNKLSSLVTDPTFSVAILAL